jgi:hypothetical protein
LEKSGVPKDNWPLNNGSFVPCIKNPIDTSIELQNDKEPKPYQHNIQSTD